MRGAPPADELAHPPHRIVRENEDGRQFHERSQPDGWPRVIAKNEERSAESPKLSKRQSIHDRSHGMLTDAKMQVLPSGCLGLEVSCASKREGGLVRGPQVG